MEELYVSNILAENILQLSEDLLLSTNPVFGQALRDHLSGDHNGIVPYSLYAHFYEACIKNSGDELFGLHQGEKYNMAALGIVGQIIQVSATLREGIQNCCEHFNLISNILRIDYSIGEECIDLAFVVDPQAKKEYPLATRHILLSSMVFAYVELYYLTSKKITPELVAIDFPEHELKPLERVFNTSVGLNSQSSLMRFGANDLDSRIVFADFELLQVLEAVACERIQSMRDEMQGLTGKITTMIYHLLSPDLPSFEVIAENFNMSPRALQRKLKKEGTSFTIIVEDIKKKLAVDYLKKELSIKEVSYLMGYSEPSAFVTAFKKWFGNTPGQFRSLL